MALQQRNPSALTEWHAQAFGLQLQLHDVICHILSRSWLESFSKFNHSAKFTKTSTPIKPGWVDAMKSSGLCNTFKTNMIAGRNVWLQKISDPKRDLDRVPGLTGDLRHYSWRQVYELSVHVSRSHSGLSARFCYAVVSMRSSAQEEDKIIEHAQCCPGN